MDFEFSEIELFFLNVKSQELELRVSLSNKLPCWTFIFIDEIVVLILFASFMPLTCSEKICIFSQNSIFATVSPSILVVN